MVESKGCSDVAVLLKLDSHHPNSSKSQILGLPLPDRTHLKTNRTEEDTIETLILSKDMSLPTSFKAAVVPHAKAQHAVTERSLSALAADEVAVRVTATAINPADWKFRDQDAFIPEYPAVVGTDAAGEVVAVGADVRNFVVGERVFFQGTLEKGYPSSTFQQYCKMPASLLARTPSAISDEQAAGIQLATMAVVTGFYDSTVSGIPTRKRTA